MGSGPASRPLAKSYRKKFARYLSIKLKIKLESKAGSDRSVQERRYRFVLSRKKQVLRQLTLTAGADSLNVDLRVVPGKGLKLEGTLTAGGQRRPVRVAVHLLGGADGRERRRIKMRRQVGNTKLGIKLDVVLVDKLGQGAAWDGPGTPPPPRPAAQTRRKRRYQFAMRFKNAKLAHVLKMLAKMNGYKITYNEKLGKTGVVNLKIKTKLRKDLLSVACARLGLSCKVKGDILQVTKSLSPSRVPPVPPAPSTSKGSTPPAPPTPPTR